VFIGGRDDERLGSTAKAAARLDGQVVPARCDVTEPAQVDSAIAAPTHGDEVAGLLLHKAAGAFVQFAEEITPKNGWAAAVGVSLTGVPLTSHAGWRARRELAVA